MNPFKRELMWLVLPVLALGGFGLLLQNPRLAQKFVRQPFRLEIEKVTRETPTPYEVSQGYDTKIGVVLTHRGPQPPWWDKQSGYTGNSGQDLLFNVSTGRKMGLVFKWNPGYDSQTNRYTTRYLLKLAAIPSDAELRLRDHIAPLGPANVAVKKPQCAPVKFDILARKKGEKTAIPTVSRDSGLRFVGWSLDEAPPANMSGYGGKLRLRVQLRTKAPDQLFLQNESLMMVDRGGREFSLSSTSGNADDLSFVPWSAEERAAKRTIKHYFDFDKKELLQATGPLWLRSNLRLGTNWPLKFQIPLRDAKGKIAFTRRAPAKFWVVQIAKRLPSAEEKLSGVESVVILRLGKTQSDGTVIEDWRWEHNHAARLVDDQGRVFWISAGGNTRVTDLSRSSDSQAVSFEYGIDESKLPLSIKKLWFKNEIGIVGGERVPVSIQIR